MTICTDKQKKLKARLRESRLLAPSGRGGKLTQPKFCLFLHVCMLFSIKSCYVTYVQGCDALSHVSGRTKRTNPIWICIWFGYTKFAFSPKWYHIFVSVRTKRTNLIWFCIWFGDPKYLFRSQPCLCLTLSLFFFFNSRSDSSSGKRGRRAARGCS